ncbi:MAG: hypothetical protein OER88_01710 [Planctomycetota bacterium]|nr:hypothetical protein [Planctomycetota bacterium]
MRILACLAVVLCVCFADESDPKLLHKDHAPTPYSAAEIRAASSHGRVTTFTVKQPSGVIRQTYRFLAPDVNGVLVEGERTGADGKAQPKQAKRSAWRELQAHASFPAAATKIEDATMRVPFGTFACRLYTVTRGTSVMRFYFANAIPGPPIRLIQTVDGKEIMTMTIVAHRAFDYEKVFGKQSLEGAKVTKESVDVAARLADIPAKVGSAQQLEAAVKTDLSFRHVALRVKSGALAGAILRVRDGSEESRTLTKAFTLPAGFALPPGELKVEIVDLRRRIGRGVAPW